MANVTKNYEILSTRTGFNAAVRHVKSAVSIAETLTDKRNLADEIQGRLASEGLDAGRVAALLRMLLVDKLGYVSSSRNMEAAADDPSSLAAEIARWNAVDLVLAYHHPDLGLLVANPKSAEQLAALGGLRKREFLVAYAGRFEKPADALCSKAASIVLDLMEGKKPKVPPELLKGDCSWKPPKAKKDTPAAPSKRGRKPKAAEPAKAGPAVPAPAPAPKTPARMTPMYSVTVQNELFHNGNVEAWKRIIDSYKTKHPNLEVYIYYDGERIVNINSLFKWGKVKHGSTIQFAVAGNDIKDVAKLQRYLIQGASHHFEAFLRGPVSTVLKLF